MKHYPSIDGQIIDKPITAFDKLDGSQVRCEWDRKHGLHKFGSRKVLLGEDHLTMGRAISLTQEKFGESLPRIFRDERLEFVTCYFEFHGEKSFAGMHELDDPTLTTTLIDVDIYKRGMPVARDFLKMFEGKVAIPKVLYAGNPTVPFLDSVRNGSLEGMTFEGVVCKGAPLKRGFFPTMFKVKNHAWVEKVKARWGDDPKALADLL